MMIRMSRRPPLRDEKKLVDAIGRPVESVARDLSVELVGTLFALFHKNYF